MIDCHQFFGIPYAKYDQRWDESILIENELNLVASEKGNSAPQTRSMIKANQE